MPTIIFNGKTYSNIEEMPANERQAYEQVANMFVDKNGNGIPDFLEGDMVQNVLRAYSTKVDVNGATYHSLDDLPPEMRQSVEGAFQKLSELGIPMVMSGAPQMQNPQVNREPMASSKPFVSREYSPTIQEDKGTSPLVWLMIGGVLILCTIAAVVGILLMGN